jgi:hypothetical protein
MLLLAIDLHRLYTSLVAHEGSTVLAEIKRATSGTPTCPHRRPGGVDQRTVML